MPQLLAFNLSDDGINIPTKLVNPGDSGFQLGVELSNVHTSRVSSGST